MATFVLSAVGAAVGGAIGGTVMGLGAATIGRFAGAVAGYSLDQMILGKGSDAIETGRVDRLRLNSAGEGDPVARIYGRVRVPGHVIWATRFREHVNESGGGGKGSRSTPKVREYSYSISLAIALCEGEITHVARIWADGQEIARKDIDMRVYPGSSDQLPDPKIEAVEGVGQVPAYRGTAYVVIENLNLGRFGNRVPQFSFEVCRPAQPHEPGAEHDPAHSISGVALLPGTGEYALATTPVALDHGPGASRYANVNTPSGQSDFLTSLANLDAELPKCGAVSLIVSWFGDDLRCSDCQVKPKVEQKQAEASKMPWTVSGLLRPGAENVPLDEDNRPIYGGTPSDQSVIEAIRKMRQEGKEVMFYPFILMEQTSGNNLPDPYSDALDQPILPWRGRITTSVAPGRAGSPDGTVQAAQEVADFFGTANASHFSEAQPTLIVPEDGPLFQQDNPRVVAYSGPDEWSYRRFILHNAYLCALAGGVESFCIGSEMRGLTQIRGSGNSFPAVTALIDLAAEVRQILGPDVKISYAADWSEYFGYQPGGGDRFFHLDPLWADANIDFIGIDNYMPLSDWRDGQDHEDAHWGSIYNLDYLKSNVAGGEGYDWFYHSSEARAAQRRTPITDAGEAEPWVWRYKDIHSWWSKLHHDRVNGVRSLTPTSWVPRSKPIRFTEYGCAAIDRGTNQPNKFLDPKSSESNLPRYSNGQRDELIQLQYLRAMNAYWRDPANNPVSAIYEGPMVDMDHAYVWAWDARPYPYFPSNEALWSDGANYRRGHWLNGRSAGRTLSSVIQEITQAAGMADCDTSQVHGYVRGYVAPASGDARMDLQPLLLRYGVEAVERAGKLSFVTRDGLPIAALSMDDLVRDPERGDALEHIRAGEAELTGRVRLRFVEAEGDYSVVSEEAVLHDEATHSVTGSELPLVMTRAEGRQIVTRWLAEARSAKDGVRFSLPLSRCDLGPGDVVELPLDTGGRGFYRIDQSEQFAQQQRIEAVRVEPKHYQPIEFPDTGATLAPIQVPSPVLALFMDLPLVTGDERPHAPHLAVTALDWPGDVAVFASDQDAGYGLKQVIKSRATVGLLQSDLPPAGDAVMDRGPDVIVRMLSGELQTISDTELFNGHNLCAIGDGTPDGYELIQFRDAELIGPDLYRLSTRLRGLRGTGGMRSEPWPAGSYLIKLERSLPQLDLAPEHRGQSRHYRIGPASQSLDHPSFEHQEIAFEGVGLRPYAPVHLRAQKVANGDLRVSWIRRTRLGGDRWDIPDVPLSEEAERYLVRVRVGGTVLYEVTTHSPEWVWPVADQVSGEIELHVAQISGEYGAGRVARLEYQL